MSLSPFRVVDPWPKVPNRLKVRMLNKDIGGVTGLMPQQVNVGFTNSWQPAVGDLFRSFNTGLQAAQEYIAGANKVDYTLNFKELTNQIWTGTGSMGTSLNLVYISRADGPMKEVIDPVKMILQLCGPSVALQLGGELTPGNRVSATMLKPPRPFMLEIGYVMAWQFAIPTSVALVISNISDHEGTPTKIEVQLGLQTDKAYVVNDPEVSVQSGKWQPVNS